MDCSTIQLYFLVEESGFNFSRAIDFLHEQELHTKESVHEH